MDTLILKTQFEANFGLILKNLEGISAEESLIFPQNEVNCVNWLLGHLIYSRNLVLKILGKNSVWNDEHFAFYGRYINAKDVTEKLIDFELLKSYFQQTYKPLMDGLEQFENQPKSNIVELSFLSLHEIYHCGQIGYARRLLGKEGMIK
ncbi:hypothetical protein ACI75Y_12545 [Capnocytophaga stomatis]|uniref:hypothetical protein n=1 Tax=Capnocytophaga stomatis TaxID=1848904 RepID=UPI00385A9EF1